MSVLVDLFKILRDSGLLTAAFIIGAIAVFVAIVGNIKTIIELSPRRTFALVLFGIVLMGLSVGGYSISLQTTPTPAETSAKGSTSVALASPTIPTATPSASNLCPDYVSRSKVQSWSIGEMDVETVDNKVREFNASRKYPRGNFKAGDRIPAGVVVATAFDGAGRKWSEFPVKPLVHRGDYGLFETLQEYIAPYEGACVSIAP